MAKNTKALSGPAKRKYFRDALQAEPGVAPEALKRLVDKFDAELSHMRVRQHASLNASGQSDMAATTQAIAPLGDPTEPAFDPHAFSLVVVMTKHGAEGLRGRLEAIDSVAHLKALARAQHVVIDGAIDSPAALRAAIIAGTAQRIADRRAAAS